MKTNKENIGNLPIIKSPRAVKRLGKNNKRITNSKIKMSMHGVKQLFNEQTQLSLFSDEKVDTFATDTGLMLTNRPSVYGAMLTPCQSRVFEGILKAFSDTDYKGDKAQDLNSSFADVYEATHKAKETLITNQNAPYKNIKAIPMIHLNQTQVIELAGYDSRNQGYAQDVVEALGFLAGRQFLFYWKRNQTQNGKLTKDKDGDYIREEVEEVSTLLRVKQVTDEKTKAFLYYEIQPTACLLDQIENYFLLVPYDWRAEAKKITGRKLSTYTYHFLLWLRMKYEQIRRANQYKGKRNPYVIKTTWEQIAVTLKMPPSFYARQRKKAKKLIETTLEIATKLGYLVKVEDDDAVSTLWLNEDFFYKPESLLPEIPKPLAKAKTQKKD